MLEVEVGSEAGEEEGDSEEDAFRRMIILRIGQGDGQNCMELGAIMWTTALLLLGGEIRCKAIGVFVSILRISAPYQLWLEVQSRMPRPNYRRTTRIEKARHRWH